MKTNRHKQQPYKNTKEPETKSNKTINKTINKKTLNANINLHKLKNKTQNPQKD